MDGDKVWRATMQPNRGITIPVEVARAWGLPDKERAVLYFIEGDDGHVIVLPAKELAAFASERS
jgi:bifunctional DNA-binding transcriptional regulator/antitoxin component of YhaV-PrlF toxin-antitoxin module